MFYWRRSVVALVTLAAVSAVLLGPGAAHARPRETDRPSVQVEADLWRDLWVWASGLGSFLEKAGWGMDPNGGGGAAAPSSATGASDAGWGMDPNGLP